MPLLQTISEILKIHGKMFNEESDFYIYKIFKQLVLGLETYGYCKLMKHN